MITDQCISVTDLKRNMKSILSSIKTSGPKVIFSNNKPIAVLKDIEDSDLSILWIVRGEKRVYVGGGMGCLSEYNPCGIYYLDNSKSPEGFLKMHKRV